MYRLALVLGFVRVIGVVRSNGGVKNLCSFNNKYAAHPPVQTLQHTAIHCNTLQHAATHSLQQGAFHLSSFSNKTCLPSACSETASHRKTLQHTHCNRVLLICVVLTTRYASHSPVQTLQHTPTHCNTPIATGCFLFV